MSTPGTIPRRKTAWRAVFALFCVTLIWGFTFVWMKQGMQVAELELGPERESTAAALFMLLRFGSAAIVMILVVPAVRRGLTRAAWTGGLWLGGLLFVGFALQMIGLAGVSPAVSAFLTSLYVLFTALISGVRHKQKPSLGLCAGVLLATLGAGFVRGRPELAFNLGELLTVGCAIVFALHILVTDHITKRVDPMPVTFTSFAVVAILSAVMLAFTQRASSRTDLGHIGALVVDPEFITPMALSALFATVLALSLMNFYQRDLDPVRAAILYALEPIWAASVGIALGMDSFNHYLWLGGALLFGGNIVAELSEQRAERRAS